MRRCAIGKSRFGSLLAEDLLRKRHQDAGRLGKMVKKSGRYSKHLEGQLLESELSDVTTWRFPAVAPERTVVETADSKCWLPTPT